MKKKYIIIYFLLFIFILGACSSKYNIVYKPGKDTYKLFGDGTYQLLSSAVYDDNNNIISKRYGLFNCEYGTPILFNVLDYEKNKEVVCFIGKEEDGDQVFIVLYIDSNIIKYYNNNGNEPQFTYVNNLLIDGKLKIAKNADELSDEERKCYNALKYNV